MNLYNKVPFIKKAYENQKNNNSFGLPNRPNKRSLSRNPQDTVKTEQDSVPALQKFLKEALNYSIRFVTAVKTVSINYNLSRGTLIPGFMPTAKWLGTTPNNKFAPGFAFVFGSQDLSIIDKAIENSWLSTDSMLNAALNQKTTENLNAQIKVEPFK